MHKTELLVHKKVFSWNFKAKKQKSPITDSYKKIRLGKYNYPVQKMRSFKVGKEATCSSFVITTFVLVRPIHKGTLQTNPKLWMAT